MYSYLFEGEVTDEAMVMHILRGMVFDSDYSYCVLFENTVCWFRVQDYEVRKLGTMYFNEPLSRYSCGRFIKRLRYKLVASGCNLNKISYLVWDKMPLLFRDYIFEYKRLIDFFGHVQGLSGKSCYEVIKLLGKKYSPDVEVTADSFVDSLADSSKSLELRDRNGTLRCRRIFFKDYSICVGNETKNKNCKYGIILDCEGVLDSDGSLQNGCREIGGIIFCNNNGILTSEYTFVADELVLEDTLCRVIDVYKSITDSVIPKGGIEVYVFGKSDITMMKNTISKFSRKGQSYLKNRFMFVDSSRIIRSFLNTSGIVIENRRKSLSNIATQLGVRMIKPRHNALSDARTLFNVLAYIYLNERSSEKNGKKEEVKVRN